MSGDLAARPVRTARPGPLQRGRGTWLRAAVLGVLVVAGAVVAATVDLPAVDPVRNDRASREARVISPDGSPVTVTVVPTNEELEIARQTVALLDHRA